jgi:NAD(P)-dependent dehydrogenase (short-subunit alcohol dehydrogenase family)
MSTTVLITGASRGIGLALANRFHAAGYTVIGTSRAGTETFVGRMLPLDLRQQESIAALEARLAATNTTIDILINNAGIGPDLSDAIPATDSFAETFAVNLSGTVFFTEAICQHLAAGAKIINISSKMGAIALCEDIHAPAYRMSKTALNMYTKMLANRFAGKYLVAAIHPGWVRTAISQASLLHGRLLPEASAESIFQFVTQPFAIGVFWNAETQEYLPW